MKLSFFLLLYKKKPQKTYAHFKIWTQSILICSLFQKLISIKTYTDSQKHEFILLHTYYVYTEQIFDSRPFMYNKIFWKNSYRSW